MFVKKSAYEAMCVRAWRAEAAETALRAELVSQIGKWNALVQQINALGPGAFQRAAAAPAPQFTADELRSLIQLCHPDKHDGKQIATDLTAKLLRLKERVQ